MSQHLLQFYSSTCRCLLICCKNLDTTSIHISLLCVLVKKKTSQIHVLEPRASVQKYSGHCCVNWLRRATLIQIVRSDSLMIMMVKKGVKLLRLGMICWQTQETMTMDQGWTLKSDSTYSLSSNWYLLISPVSQIFQVVFSIKSHGFSQAKREPGHVWWLWLGPWFWWARAASSQAGPGKSLSVY